MSLLLNVSWKKERTPCIQQNTPLSCPMYNPTWSVKIVPGYDGEKPKVREYVRGRDLTPIRSEDYIYYVVFTTLLQCFLAEVRTNVRERPRRTKNETTSVYGSTLDGIPLWVHLLLTLIGGQLSVPPFLGRLLVHSFELSSKKKSTRNSPFVGVHCKTYVGTLSTTRSIGLIR